MNGLDDHVHGIVLPSAQDHVGLVAVVEAQPRSRTRIPIPGDVRFKGEVGVETGHSGS